MTQFLNAQKNAEEKKSGVTGSGERVLNDILQWVKTFKHSVISLCVGRDLTSLYILILNKP